MDAVKPTTHEALLLQLAALAGDEPASSFLELRTLRPDGGPGPRQFISVRELRQAVDAVLAMPEIHVYIGGAPRMRESGTAADVERCWCLWCDSDTDEAVEALRRFRPTPAIVVATSPGRVQAYWPLKRPVSPTWARRANRRIATALGSDLAATDPARILRAVGSYNHKHSPPTPVVALRVELDVFDAGKVAGKLPDAPGEAPARPSPVVPGAQGRGSVAGLVRTVRDAQPGNRNARLYWAACAARDEGHDDAREELRETALATGLTEREVERTLDSAFARSAAA
jgi:hypothetical protein